MTPVLLAVLFFATSGEPAKDPAAEGLIQAGLRFPGRTSASPSGTRSLCRWPDKGEMQAQQCRGGHPGFDGRFQQALSSSLCGSCSEIAAESWPWQAHDSMDSLGKEMFHCWQQSPGHWQTASTRHRWFGAAMAQGRNGIWYACIIVGD